MRCLQTLSNVQSLIRIWPKDASKRFQEFCGTSTCILISTWKLVSGLNALSFGTEILSPPPSSSLVLICIYPSNHVVYACKTRVMPQSCRYLFSNYSNYWCATTCWEQPYGIWSESVRCIAWRTLHKYLFTAPQSSASWRVRPQTWSSRREFVLLTNYGCGHWSYIILRAGIIW